MAIKAHLNGGPVDDTVVVSLGPIYFISRFRHDLAISHAVVHRAVMGSYRARLDGYGQYVPYNLEGIAEFDWEGWDDE